MEKSTNNRAWLFVMPALFLLAFVAIIPIIFVVDYSFHDIFHQKPKIWVGLEWYRELLDSIRFWQTFGRSLLLSTIGVDFDWKLNAFHIWVSIVLMDVWHWTSLVVLLCYSSLATIPAAFYRAAAIDGASRWNVFRYIELPKMKGVLLMAILLRFIDSFMVYAEPFRLNAGGPRSSTTFLAMELAGDAFSYNYGPAAARAVIYFIIILIVSWMFKTALAVQDSDSKFRKKLTDANG